MIQCHHIKGKKEVGKINPWLETIGIIFIALMGVLLGSRFARFRKPYWACGYFIPFILTGLLFLATINNALLFVAPFSWVTAGRVRFFVLAFAATMGLTTPLSRLPRKREKLVVGISMVVIVVWFSVLPVLMPALIKDDLSNLKTTVYPNGINLSRPSLR